MSYTIDDLENVFGQPDKSELAEVESKAFFWDSVREEADRIINEVDVMEVIFSEVSNGDGHKFDWNKKAYGPPSNYIEAPHVEVVKRIAELEGLKVWDLSPYGTTVEYYSYIIYAKN